MEPRKEILGLFEYYRSFLDSSVVSSDLAPPGAAEAIQHILEHCPDNVLAEGWEVYRKEYNESYGYDPGDESDYWYTVSEEEEPDGTV